MDITRAFEVAFNRKKEKNWEKIYVIVDIHDTILKACYENEEVYDYYPYAREALQLMTTREDICLILWSGCYEEKMNEYRNRFAEEGIRFDYSNENPEVGNTSFQNFEAKLYFNVGIDDKFGFEPETDWIKVIEALLWGISDQDVYCFLYYYSFPPNSLYDTFSGFHLSFGVGLSAG